VPLLDQELDTKRARRACSRLACPRWSKTAIADMYSWQPTPRLVGSRRWRRTWPARICLGLRASAGDGAGVGKPWIWAAEQDGAFVLLPPGAADVAPCMLGRLSHLLTSAPACDPLDKFMSMSIDPHFTSWFLHVLHELATDGWYLASVAEESLGVGSRSE
jgi:hypothetical protein